MWQQHGKWPIVARAWGAEGTVMVGLRPVNHKLAGQLGLASPNWFFFCLQPAAGRQVPDQGRIPRGNAQPARYLRVVDSGDEYEILLLLCAALCVRE